MKKTMMFVALIVTMVCLVGLCSVAFAAETFIEDGFEYKVVSRKEVEIIGYSGSDDEPSISSSVNGYEVVGIGASAFRDNHNIKELLIWADLEYIGDYAFYNCTSLSEFSIPNKVVTIGGSAFEGCTSLAEITFWGGKNIGHFAFKNCISLKAVSLPSSMETVGDYAFEGCINLVEYDTWNDDVLIGKGAFSGCPLERETVAPTKVENEEFLPSTAENTVEHTVQIHINFIPNLMFSTYDVEFSINGDFEDTFEHGEDQDLTLKLHEGIYTFEFASADSSSIDGEVTLEVSSDIDASYKIACYSDKVDVEVEYIDRKVPLAAGEVKMLSDKYAFTDENYETVIAQLKELGFNNIITLPVYDIVFGWTEENSVKNVTINGADDYNRGSVFSSDAEVVVTYHLLEEDDPAKKEETSVEQTESAVLPTATITPTATLVPTPTPEPICLKKGSKGEEVKQLQEYLIQLGYLDGKIDGDFGNKTKAAVEAFQKAFSLEVSGIVDNDDMEMILKAMDGLREIEAQYWELREEWIDSQFSVWDGSHNDLEELIKEVLKDRKSYDHIETSYIDITDETKLAIVNETLHSVGNKNRAEIGDLLIIVEFSAKNAYNATIKSTAYGIASYENNTISLVAIE